MSSFLFLFKVVVSLNCKRGFSFWIQAQSFIRVQKLNLFLVCTTKGFDDFLLVFSRRRRRRFHEKTKESRRRRRRRRRYRRRQTLPLSFFSSWSLYFCKTCSIFASLADCRRRVRFDFVVENSSSQRGRFTFISSTTCSFHHFQQRFFGSEF